MAFVPNKLAHTVLREWREKQLNAGFFSWLESLGRKDDEVEEIVYYPEDKHVSITFFDRTTEQTYLTLEY